MGKGKVDEVDNFRCWHGADIKLRPLFGGYGVESGQHLLGLSLSAFDPKRTLLEPLTFVQAFHTYRVSGFSQSPGLPKAFRPSTA
jgi:hypothetical protein